MNGRGNTNDVNGPLAIDGGGFLQISRVGKGTRGERVIVAAHPADVFNEGTAALLATASGLPVLCVNPRGLGESSSAPATFDPLTAMVDDVEAARRALGIERCLFWGMSGGGWLGQLYARRYPGVLLGLVLESACACFRARLADPACILSPFHPAWAAALAAHGMIDVGSHAQAGDPADTAWVEVDGVGSVFRRRAGAALLVSPVPVAAAMRQVMPALWAFDARPWLGELRLPTLVIAGTADPVVPLTHARALADAIPGAVWREVEGGGHVPVAQGRAEVGEAVRRFAQDLGAISSLG